MPSRDWFPAREQDVVDLAQKWVTIIGKDENLSAYNWDMTECTALINKLNAFLAARTAFEADDSSTKRRAKNDARKMAEAAMRAFANSDIRYNKNIPEEGKQLLGMRIKDTTPTQHHAPTSQPETIVENT